VFSYERHVQPSGDAFYYHFQANLLVSGKAFVQPYDFLLLGRNVPGADHPPLFTLVLALASVLGLKTFFSQVLWTCAVGALGVFLIGIAAREVAGARVGLIAAGIAAFYPVFVINDGAVMSETLVSATTALVLLCYYRLWRQPSYGRALWLGLSIAAAALTRPEFALALPLLVLPLVFRKWKGQPVGRRIGLAAVLSAAVLGGIAPWWAYNSTRFTDQVPLSTQLGTTLLSANCDSTYYGPRIGYWAFSCGQQLGVHLNAKDDPSVQDNQMRSVAVSYIRKHESRLAVVMAARVGREFGLFAPAQQVDLEWQALGRPRLPAFVGLGAYYAVALMALPGAVILRRRKTSLLPMGVILVDTVLVCLATFGQTRYRSSFDVVLVVLAAVTLEELWPWRIAPVQPPPLEARGPGWTYVREPKPSVV